MTEEIPLLERAARIHPDLPHPRTPELVPQPSPQVQRRRPLPGLRRTPRQVLLDVFLHVSGHLVALTANTRPQQHLDALQLRTQRHHRLQRLNNNPNPRTNPPSVHRPNNSGRLITKQHRHAVRRQHHQPETSLFRHNRISSLKRLGHRPVHDPNSAPVHLLHPDQPLRREPNALSKPNPVGLNRLRIVPNMIAEVEGVVRALGHATSAGGDNTTNTHAHTLVRARDKTRDQPRRRSRAVPPHAMAQPSRPAIPGPAVGSPPPQTQPLTQPAAAQRNRCAINPRVAWTPGVWGRAPENSRNASSPPARRPTRKVAVLQGDHPQGRAIAGRPSARSPPANSRPASRPPARPPPTPHPQASDRRRPLKTKTPRIPEGTQGVRQDQQPPISQPATGNRSTSNQPINAA